MFLMIFQVLSSLRTTRKRASPTSRVSMGAPLPLAKYEMRVAMSAGWSRTSGATSSVSAAGSYDWASTVKVSVCARRTQTDINIINTAKVFFIKL